MTSTPRRRVHTRLLRAPAGFRRGVAALALLAAACGGERPARGDRPLVLGYSSELQTLNPLVSTDQNANELIYHLLFVPLVRYDSAYRPAPALAESWELSDTAVTFHLREGVRWHDGRPVTAEDVAFTFRRAREPEAASPLAAAYLRNVASVEVLAPLEVRFRFTEPHAQPLEDFYWPPVPRHLLAEVPAAELARAPWSRAPVGNGPYRFVSWEANRQLEFEANREFPAELGGPPRIGRLVYRIVPEPTTLVSELLTGGVHVDGPLGPVDAGRVQAAEGVRLERFPWRLFAYIGWNTRRPAFESAAVRRALAMAIDREGILRTILEGYGRPAVGPIPPWHPYAPDVEPLPFDPDAARRTLAAEGWRDRDGDGVRDRDGAPLRFELLANQRSPIYGDVAQVVQAQLREVGVDAIPRMLEWQTVLARHRARDFDAVLTNWVLDNFRVDPRPLFHGDQVEVPNSANRSSYSDPVADSLMEAGVRARDETEARAIWAELTRVLQRDQPVTFLFWQDELAGVSAALRGVRMDARGELVTVSEWRWAP